MTIFVARIECDAATPRVNALRATSIADGPAPRGVEVIEEGLGLPERGDQIPSGHIEQLRDLGVTERVVDGRAVLPRGHQPRLAEDRELLGKVGKLNADDWLHLADGVLPAFEGLKDLNSCWVSQSFEQLSFQLWNVKLLSEH